MGIPMYDTTWQGLAEHQADDAADDAEQNTFQNELAGYASRRVHGRDRPISPVRSSTFMGGGMPRTMTTRFAGRQDRFVARAVRLPCDESDRSNHETTSKRVGQQL